VSAKLSKGRPDLKLRRAQRHATELREAILAYRSSNAFHAEQTPRVAEGTVELTLRVNSPPPLDEWSLIFGDSVHNLRAALDHLAWQLDSRPGRDTNFPILSAPPSQWPPSAVRRMPPDARDIIDAVQPHWEDLSNRSVGLHPLVALHSFDISDKHRVLIGTEGAVGGDSIEGLVFGASLESAIWQPFEDGVTMGRIRFPNGKIQPFSCTPYFQAVLIDPPWTNADVLWMLDAVLMEWITGTVIQPLLPLARS
jgi:hypothetical protein